MVVPKQKRPASAKARIDSYSENDLKKSTLPPRPPWRPFTRASSLTKIDGQQGFLNSNIEIEGDVRRGKNGDTEDDEEPSVYANRYEGDVRSVVLNSASPQKICVNTAFKVLQNTVTAILAVVEGFSLVAFCKAKQKHYNSLDTAALEKQTMGKDRN